MRPRRTALAAAFAAAGLMFSTTAAWAEGIATVTDAKGDVTVGSAKVARIGSTNRFRGGMINANDSITTGADGEATIELADKSVLKIGENAKLSISEMKSTGSVAMGKAMTRTVKVAAGKVYGDIKPNSGVFTQFDTPSGVAAVRGTTLEIVVIRGTVEVRCDSGGIRYYPVGGNGTFTLASGQVVQVTPTANNTAVEIKVVSGDPVKLVVGDKTVTIPQGSAVQSQTTDTGTTSVNVTAGSVSVTDTTTNITTQNVTSASPPVSAVAVVENSGSDRVFRGEQVVIKSADILPSIQDSSTTNDASATSVDFTLSP